MVQDYGLKELREDRFNQGIAKGRARDSKPLNEARKRPMAYRKQ